MGESGDGGVTAAEVAAAYPGEGDAEQPEIIVISERGDVVLDVTFRNSRETIRSARKAAAAVQARAPPPSQPRQQATDHGKPRAPAAPAAAPAPPKARIRLAFRVELATLRRQSKYFDRLLAPDGRFREARAVTEALEALSLRGVRPADADARRDLPWVEIRDDDEATSYAYREAAFADILRILHGRDVETAQGQITMSFVTTLAVLADRFDCAAAVSKYVASGLKFKWPATTGRGSKPTTRDDGSGSGFGGGMSRASENVLRQKILVSWLLNQPGKFQAATRELIMNGSCQWTTFGEEDEEQAATSATWWYLQDGLEQELQYRRNCVLNTIASVPRHFLSLYTAPRGARQCKLGYDSSVACDSYQLGEMFKFLTNKGLLFPVDFAPGSLDDAAYSTSPLMPVDAVLAVLRQCPAYQIDKNHTNCGLRTRMLPILDFIQGLLSANSIPISRAAWKGDRAAHAWMSPENEGATAGKSIGREESGKPFRFTRSLAGDQRLRFENAMGADKFARDVFAATSWDWTADDQGPDHISTTPKWSFR